MGADKQKNSPDTSRPSTPRLTDLPLQGAGFGPELSSRIVLQLIEQHAHDFIAFHDSDGRFLYASPASFKQLGYKPEELIGQSVFDMFHPEDSHLLEQQQERIRQGDSEPVIHRLQQKNGDYHWFETSTTQISGDEFPCTCVLIVSREVDQREKLARALEKSEGAFRDAFAAASHGMAITDIGGRFVQVNQRLCDMLGYSEAELLQMDFKTITYEADLEFDLERLRKLTSGDVKYYSAEKRYLRKDGSPLHVLLSVSMVYDENGEPKHYVGQLIDLTDRKRSEQAMVEQGRLKATSVLAAGFSHDINNLMSIILGNVGMLQRDEAAGTDLSDRLWTIEQSAKRVAKIADELIAFARMGNYNPRPLQINSLLEETLVTYQRSKDHHAQLNQVLRAAPDIVIADGSQIQQLVIHLIENAIEATVETNGDVFISTSNEVRQQPLNNGSNGFHYQSYVSLTVRDDGHGMDAGTLDHIYEPFFSTRGPGRGMGLSAVYGIVEQYNGIIEVESEPGEGTIFRILLPAEHIEQEPVPEEELDTRDASGTILVVDDEAGIREMLTSLFERVGYTALGAENGKVALDLIAKRDGQVDLVLLDLLMPEMDGATTFAHLHRDYPDLPVLLISGYDHDERVASLMNDGALAFIQKPFELELVLREVRRALELSRQESPSL